MRAVLATFLLSCLALSGCGDTGWDPVDGEPPFSVDAGSDADQAADVALDDAGAPPPDGDGILARDGTGLDASRAGAAGCYDPGDGACAGDDCLGVRSCCVGSGACCTEADAEEAPSLVVPSGCTEGTEAEVCIGDAVRAFGLPRPYVLPSGIVLSGDGIGDSGLLSTATVDLTIHRATLTARFHQPTDCAGGCFETAAIGMTEQSDVTSDVRPIAALQYSAARNRVALVVGTAQVMYWDDVTDGSEWTLALQPSGEVDVLLGSESVLDIPVPYRPRPGARVALYGQSVNPTSMALPTRIEVLDVSFALCDVPDSWTGRAPLRVELSGGAPLDATAGATSPSLLRASAMEILVWEQAGTIRMARDEGAGFVGQDSPLVTAGDEAWSNERVGDPALIAKPDGGYSLFYTAWGESGPSIARQDLSATLDLDGVATQAVDVSSVSAEALMEPAVWVHEAELWLMAVHAVENGTHFLRILRSDDAGVSWALHRSAALEGLTARTGGSGTNGAFDADEVGHPSLTIHNGAWHLHYAGRRGTRSGVGLFLSDDLVNWRNPTPMDPVLAPGANAFEQVAVTAPDVLAVGTGLTMVYVGHDGYQGRLASATRRGTDNGSF